MNLPKNNDELKEMAREANFISQDEIREPLKITCQNCNKTTDYGLNCYHCDQPIILDEYDGRTKIQIVADLIKYDNTFVTIKDSNEILFYNGKIYSSSLAEATIKETTEKEIKDCTTHERNEVLQKIKASTYQELEKFDSDSNLLTLENGILNIEKMELSDHSAKHLSRVLFPVEYTRPEFPIRENSIFEDIEKNLEKTVFWKFLKSSFTVNGEFQKEDFETILEIIASCFLKKHVDGKAAMFLGNGDNGKSVCNGFIESLLGENNVSHIPLQELAENRFMRAELNGISANIFNDLEQYELRKSGIIKNILTGEPIQVEKKHQTAFTLYPFCNLIFSCNRFPKAYDQSQGFFRRWLIVQWNRNFENDSERDEKLNEKLNENFEEKNQVFSCLVYLSRELSRKGKFSHAKDWLKIQHIWNSNADPVDEFVNSKTIESDTDISKRMLYSVYKEFTLEKGLNPLGIGQFGKQLSQYYDDSVDSSGNRVWCNIQIKAKEPVQEKSNDVKQPTITEYNEHSEHDEKTTSSVSSVSSVFKNEDDS